VFTSDIGNSLGENWVGVDENALLYEVYNTTKWNYAVDIHKGIKFSYRVPFPEECPFCTDSPPISVRNFKYANNTNITKVSSKIIRLGNL